MATEFKDYYQTLGVSRTASDAEIKKAFRKLARQHHPDVAKDKKTAEERFKEINEAYEVLGDPAKRQKYDELGAHWKEGAGFRPPPGWPGRAGQTPEGESFEFHFGGTGFSDFFEQFFGRGAGAGGFSNLGGEARGARSWEHSAQRGQDIEGDILVTLHEALQGSVRAVTLQRAHARTGQVETYSFKVRIPPGVQDGQVIRVPGKGEEGTGGGGPGDLYLHVRLAAHPDFRVRGADLYHDLELAPWDAVLGTTASVPTLDGRVAVRIPPGTNNGQSLRVRGRGLPRGRSDERGDLYVTIEVRLPQRLTEEQRALWEKLRSVSAADFKHE